MKDTKMQGNKRRAAHHSSVWIDPALSTYFTDGADERQSAGAAFLEPPLARQSPAAHNPPTPARHHNPTTPIPPRASAQAPNSITVRPRYPRSFVTPAQNTDVTRMKTLPPPTMWEYESQEFQAGSSLSSLSLVDAPTGPHRPTRKLLDEIAVEEVDTLPPPTTAKRELTIDEIQTIPELPPLQKPTIVESAAMPAQHVFAIDEIDTIPPQAAPPTGQLVSARALIVAPERIPAPPAQSPITPSWTAGGAAQSSYARRIIQRKDDKNFVWYGGSHGSYGRAPFRHPVDRVRWWLLHPGHIEFVLWILGALLLMSVTAALVLAAAMNLFWSAPGQSTATQVAQGTGVASTGGTGQTGHNILTLILNENGPLVAGQPLRLNGQGFTANATINLTHDQSQPCQPGSTRTNGQGAFTVTIDDSTWNAGPHHIFAQDTVTQRTTSLIITLDAGPIGKNGGSKPGSNTPTPSGGVQSTPVNTTPSPIPTAKPSPTLTPSPTQTTPTPGITPTLTPSTTVTPGVTGLTPTLTLSTTATPGVSDTSTTSLKLAGQNVPVIHGGSWFWMFITLGGSAALLMLGIAGLLRQGISRRKQV